MNSTALSSSLSIMKRKISFLLKKDFLIYKLYIIMFLRNPTILFVFYGKAVIIWSWKIFKLFKLLIYPNHELASKARTSWVDAFPSIFKSERKNFKNKIYIKVKIYSKNIYSSKKNRIFMGMPWFSIFGIFSWYVKGTWNVTSVGPICFTWHCFTWHCFTWHSPFLWPQIVIFI